MPETKFDPQNYKKLLKARSSVKDLDSRGILPSRNSVTERYARRIGILVAATQQEKLDRTKKELEETEKRRQEAEVRSRVDELTGLPNRAAFEERLKYEVDRALRDKKPFALMTLDIDHFKKVNDELGHDKGDMVLKDISEFFVDINNGRPLKRAIDFVARYGGDEFQIISPEMGTERGEEQLAEGIRNGLQKKLNKISLGGGIKLTISIGLTFYHPHTKDETSEEAMKRLVKEADIALYRAKDLGKNLVMTYIPED